MSEQPLQVAGDFEPAFPRVDNLFTLTRSRNGHSVTHTFSVDSEADCVTVRTDDTAGWTVRTIIRRPELRIEEFVEKTTGRTVLHKELSLLEDRQWLLKETMQDGGNVHAERVTVISERGVPVRSNETQTASGRLMYESCTHYATHGSPNNTQRRCYDFHTGRLTREDNILWHPSGTAAITEATLFDAAGSTSQFSKIIHDVDGQQRWEERITYSGGTHSVPLKREVILYSREGAETYRDAVHFNEFGQPVEQVSNFVQALHQAAASATAPEPVIKNASDYRRIGADHTEEPSPAERLPA